MVLNFNKAYPAWILVLKFGLEEKILSKAKCVFSLNIISLPVIVGLLIMLEIATHEFHEIFGLLLSKFETIMLRKVSILIPFLVKCNKNPYFTYYVKVFKISLRKIRSILANKYPSALIELEIGLSLLVKAKSMAV